MGVLAEYNTPFRCIDCSKRFGLLDHVIEDDGNGRPLGPMICPYCFSKQTAPVGSWKPTIVHPPTKTTIKAGQAGET